MVRFILPSRQLFDFLALIKMMKFVTGRAGSKFKPKPRPRLRKHVSVSTLSNDANEKLSTQASVANAVSENLASTGVNLEKHDKVTHAVLDEMSRVFASPEIDVQTKSIQLEVTVLEIL